MRRRRLWPLVLIAAGLDYGLRVWAGFWLGDRVQEALHLSKRPSVSFGGLLFTPQVARGNIDSATLEEDAFKVHGVAFTHARLTLDDVKFKTGKLLLHHRGVVTAASGGGVLAMTGAVLARAFKREGQDVSVTVARGHIRVSGGGLPQAVTAEAAVQSAMDVALRRRRKDDSPFFGRTARSCRHLLSFFSSLAVSFHQGQHHEADCLCIRSRDVHLRGYIRTVSRRTHRTPDGNTNRSPYSGLFAPLPALVTSNYRATHAPLSPLLVAPRPVSLVSLWAGTLGVLV